MKKIVIFTISLIVAASLTFFINKKQTVTNKEQAGIESKADAGANAMIEYFNKIMADPATGQIDLNAYYNAMAQAKTAISSRAINSAPLQWQFAGPDNIGGRTRAILFDSKNPGRVFAAGVSGGLWISSDTGQTWTEWWGSDQLVNMNIVSLCQDVAGNVYFGTGEGLYDNYGIFGGGFPGDGMWKSPDTGKIQFIQFTQLANTEPTQKNEPSLNWSEVNRIAANPHSPDSIIAAIKGGIRVSGDGGQTWAAPTGVLSGGFQGTDVKYSSDGKMVFAAVGGSLYYSTNGGRTFTDISGKDGFPSSAGIIRIELAVSPQTPDYAYAALVRSSDESIASVAQTTNGGRSWTVIGTGTGYSGDPYSTNGFDPTGDQGGYDLALTVSPIDSNTIFLGGITLWRWTLSSGWLQISNYGIEEYNTQLHSDIHALVFDPTSNGNRLVIGCDGGVNQTLDPYNANANGVLYSTLNRNYNVTQFYSMSADSQGHLLGGTQDNGNEFINFLGNTIQSGNIVVGGDGGCTQIALSNNQAFFSQIALGALLRSSNGGNTFDGYADSILNAQIGQVVGAGFYTPFNLWENADSIAVDNNDTPKRVVQSLMAVGIGGGEVWVTPDALNFSTSPNWYRLQDATDEGTITAVKFSDDGKFLYVGTSNGYLYRYTGFDSVFKNKHGRDEWSYPQVNNKTVWTWNAADSGISVVQSSYSGFSAGGRSILSIATDPNNPDHVIATCGNYGYTTYVAISNDATQNSGFTFTSAQGNGATALPSAPVYSSCITHANSLILVGTPMGVWSSSDDGKTWAPNNSGLANVTVMSLKEHPYYIGNGYALYAGTHGRGMFVSYTLDPTGINTVKKGQTVNNLTVFPNPLSNNGHIQYTLARQGHVIINLYDIDGKLVKVIADENMIAGPVDIQFNVGDLISGTYIMQVVEGQYQATQKLVVLR